MAATLYATLTVPILGARFTGMPQARTERDDAAASRLLQLLVSFSNPDETTPMMARALAEAPLSQAYSNLGWLQKRVEYHKHLSISRAFLGGKAGRYSHAGHPAMAYVCSFNSPIHKRFPIA